VAASEVGNSLVGETRRNSWNNKEKGSVFKTGTQKHEERKELKTKNKGKTFLPGGRAAIDPYDRFRQQ
jgi:hypothetical protein